MSLKRRLPGYINAEKLKELYLDQGKPVALIAEAFEVCHTTVRKAVVQAGLPPRRRRLPGYIDLETLKDLYIDQQKSLNAIAVDLGVSDTTVRNAVIRVGMPFRRKTKQAALKTRSQEIIGLYVQGWSLRQIADKFGGSKQGVSNILSAQGISRRRRGRSG